jgi:hypothetical protein
VAACVRAAWLELEGLTVQLHDEGAGHFVTALDLGSPEVREVVNNRPDADGIDDRTQYLGGRVVSCEVTALESAGATVDAVADLFAPFMMPNVRPTLHYVLDRPGLPERTLVVRAQSYHWVVDVPEQRDYQMVWVAADPIARGATAQTKVAYAGTAGLVGRSYNWTPNRVYPAGASPAQPVILNTPGVVPVGPLLRIYGPITAANAKLVVAATGAPAGCIPLVGSYTIDAGHFVEADCDAQTVTLDGNPAQSVLTSINWTAMAAGGGWPTLLPRTDMRLTLAGSSTSTATQVVATWTDGYLS